MTPKIARFIADTNPATPCLVVDIDRIEANYRALAQALPHAQIYFAVKANPAAPVLKRLVGLGSRFDAASFAEIEQCLAAGAQPAAISFGNTIKKVEAIRGAYAAGVSTFAFDSDEELGKIARHAPGSRVYCRVLVENEGAQWPLSRKFGTTAEHAVALLVRARDLGLDPYGVSFHVGSQQTSTAAYEAAIGQVAMLFTDLSHAGIPMRMINLGGGFPTRYRDEVPAISDFAAAITRALTRHFGNDLPQILVEPGRYMVGDAGVVRAEVVLTSRKGGDDPVRWVYLDIGRFGGLAETEGEAVKYQITTDHDGEPDGPVIIAGPSCDSVDTLYERSAYRLPLALESGDRVLLHATGAYVATYASQGFNGFKPLAEHYL